MGDGRWEMGDGEISVTARAHGAMSRLGGGAGEERCRLTGWLVLAGAHYTVPPNLLKMDGWREKEGTYGTQPARSGPRLP
jgi:hypothetical protein